MEQNLKPLTKEKTRQNITEKHDAQSLLNSESETMMVDKTLFINVHRKKRIKEQTVKQETAFVKMKRIEKNKDQCIWEKSEPKWKKRNRKELHVQKDGHLSEGEPFVRDANKTLDMNVEDL